MASPSLTLKPSSPQLHQHNLFCSILFNPNKSNNTPTKKALYHHCVGSTASPITIAGIQPKPKPILPETSRYIINENHNTPSETVKSLCKQGKLEDALAIFNLMKRKRIPLDKEGYEILLQECYAMNAVEDSRVICNQMVKSGIDLDASLGAKLFVMYARNGKLLNARQMFDNIPQRDLVMWNKMLSGYVKYGRGDECLRLFREMRKEEVGIDGYTIATILRACSAQSAIDVGHQVHGCVVKMEFGDYVYVGSSLVDMYAKCGRIEDARKVFDNMLRRNVVSWNAMIAGYAQHGYGEEALELFSEMQREYTRGDGFTMATILRVSVGLGTLGVGKQVHGAVIRGGFEVDIVLGSALVDLYSKWGRVEDARQVFDCMHERNIITWNAVITGYGRHGRGKESVELFERMQREGIKPNHITLSSVLFACCSSGLVNEGWKYFDSMRRDYGITPTAMHYASMVEILGRSGRLDEAYELIRKAPMRLNTYMLEALLCACRIHGNADLGELVAHQLFSLEPNKIGNYLVLLDIYVAAGRSEDAVRLKKMMKDWELNLKPECSWIEVKKRVHIFFEGDRLHSETERSLYS